MNLLILASSIHTVHSGIDVIMEVLPRSSFQRTSRMHAPLYKTGWSSLCNWKIGGVTGLYSTASSFTRRNSLHPLRSVGWSAGAFTSRSPAGPVTDRPQDAQVASSPHPKSSAYPFTEIETKWQAFWERNQTFKTPDFKDLDTSKPKFYALDMFPYPR